MTTLFNLGSVGEGLPHAENTGLVISDAAKINNFFRFPKHFALFFNENVAKSKKNVECRTLRVLFSLLLFHQWEK